GFALLQAAPQHTATCSVQPKSVVARSQDGVAQVSNLALIAIEARITPHRAVPAEGLFGLRVEATVFLIDSDNRRTAVPSRAIPSGGGGDLESNSEYTNFYLDIPIDEAERDAQIHDYLEGIAQQIAASANERERAMADKLRTPEAADAFSAYFKQHRVGRF